ncbi:BrnT family toxin [Chromohalobacter nigrandesensis]|uniref:BrnT family toxin n=1 Tax=Chromohalobacter nigrandesensis TaxID=119863 RepID=UPI001FF6C917|nr:BrnT family toxin [Chromohalobacter nigrandesensis]MCK0745854.1 BrnT family toxin [Chromohalobacter nigrandesensis]
MKPIDWNADKNQLLMDERGVSFEDVVFALQADGLLDDMVHPNKEKYPNQRIFVVRIDDYAWLVPYVEDEKALFLKTIIPSRKASRKYLQEQNGE